MLSHKIKQIRTLRGLSMDSLVERMNNKVSKMSISKYERGVMMPSSNMLEEIAKACEVPVNVFTSPPLSFGRMSFRFDKDNPSDINKEFMDSIRDILSNYVYASSIANQDISFIHPLERKTVRDYVDVENMVNLLRQAWELGCQPIVSVYEMLQINGITVLEFHDSQCELNGVSLYVNDKIPFILINTYKNPTTERKRFTALHELAHLLLDMQPISKEEYLLNEHPESHRIPDEEKLANRFAGAMLLPSKVVKSRLGEKRDSLTLAELISIKNRYGVSIGSMLYRLNDLQVITYDYRNYFFNEILNPNISEKGWGGYPLPETADSFELLKERINLNKK